MKYSSTAVILATSSSIGTPSDARDMDPTRVAPVYVGYYCMGCDAYWKDDRSNKIDDGSRRRSNVSAVIKRLGETANRRSSSSGKHTEESSTDVSLFGTNDTAPTPSLAVDNTDNLIAAAAAAKDKLPSFNNEYHSTGEEDNQSLAPSTELEEVHMITPDDDISTLLKENLLLKERLQLLREIELMEKIDILKNGISNAIIEEGWLASSSGGNSMTPEESYVMLEQVFVNILKSNEEREKQLFYQMTLTLFLVGSLLAMVYYVHDNPGRRRRNSTSFKGELTELIIPSMCPTSPTESLGSITTTITTTAREEGEGTSNKILEENKILRNQLELMRAIGPNGVINEDQEYDGSVLSDASVSAECNHNRKWGRFGVRPQDVPIVVKGLDRVEADAAAAKEASKDDDSDSNCVANLPMQRWWKSRNKRSKSDSDDRSHVSLSSMGIAASIDYQLKCMSENC